MPPRCCSIKPKADGKSGLIQAYTNRFFIICSVFIVSIQEQVSLSTGPIRYTTKELFSFAVFILKPSFRVHNVANNLTIEFKHKCKVGDEVRMISHLMHIIVLICTRFMDVPKRLTGKFFYCSVVFFCFSKNTIQ